MGKTFKRVALNPNLGGGTPGTGNPAYSQSFVIANWILNVDVYELSIPEVTHDRGINTIVQVFEKVGSLYKEVEVDVEIDATGNVKLIIESNPDLRFDGKVNIIGE